MPTNAAYFEKHSFPGLRQKTISFFFVAAAAYKFVA